MSRADLQDLIDATRYVKQTQDRLVRRARRKQAKLDRAARDFYELYLEPRLRTAKLYEYSEWLERFLDLDGSFSHVHPHQFEGFHVLMHDAELQPLSFLSPPKPLNIIVPAGVTVITRNHGEYLGRKIWRITPTLASGTNLYLADGRQLGSYVPLFSDIAFI